MSTAKIAASLTFDRLNGHPSSSSTQEYRGPHNRRASFQPRSSALDRPAPPTRLTRNGTLSPESSDAFIPRVIVWFRRNFAVVARSTDGPFTIRVADLHHRAMQIGGLVSWRSTPRQNA